MMPVPLTNDPATGGVRMALKVVPGASRDRILGVLGDALKIAVSKPPADGAANKAVIRLLAAHLALPAASITITRGHASPRKEVLITGLSAQELAARLAIDR
jgi:uncharacterized protein (TIGR00251 family)